MKYYTTKKAVNDGYINKISISYCNLDHLLKYQEPEAHTFGSYGWNADIYKINRTTCIVTGYQPFGNIAPDYKTIKKYDDLAKNEKDPVKINELLNKFVNEVLK